MSKQHVRPFILLAFLTFILAGIPMRSAAPVAEDPPRNGALAAGRNVNMVSGTKLPLGDPWVQRQNEPSVAVSSRNPWHLFAAANDYRTVDMSDNYSLRGIPGLSAVRDSWIGVFESFNHGESWITTMLPGFPQDSSNEGIASPIHGFDTACDPIVRAGANGLLYLSGIAFNRSQQAGAVFVARYVDRNNREKVEIGVDEVSGLRQYVGPIEYMDTKLVDAGNSGQFIDMPNMAVDVPRNGAPYGTIYLAYTVFLGNTSQFVRSRIVIVRSRDGGQTWSNPVKLTESQHIIQRPVISVDPSDPTGNTVYVAFRRFAFGTAPGGIVFVKSVDGGASFSKPADAATLLYPFDQWTSTKSFRTNSYPTMAVDANGTACLAWAQRLSADGPARIVISYLLAGGTAWSDPQIVDPGYMGIGHQFMPAMTYGGGKLTLAWYDQRDDIALHAENAKFIEDEWGDHRHTIDVRAAEGFPGPPPVFQASIPVSRYLYYIELDANGEPKKSADGEAVVYQGEANFLNYNLFELGTKPFLGDYMEIVSSPGILPPFATRSAFWTLNTAPAEPTTSPVVWTDNRDVWPPGGYTWGNWSSYHPPDSEQDGDFFQTNPCQAGGTGGMRNQNVYTSDLNHGIIVGSPGNTKQLDIKRSFVVFARNTTEFPKSLRLSLAPATGISASFEQFASKTALDVVVLPYSSISSTVYVDAAASSGGLFGPVEVLVNQAVGGALVGRIFLNPDSTNNLVLDPVGGDLGYEVHTPHMGNPKVWKYDVGNPKEPNSSFLSPRAQNPRAQNSGYVNPRAQNESYENPRAQNPRAQNLGVQNENIVNNEMLNPRAQNASAMNTALTDMVWTVSNEGNTTSAYSFSLVSDSEEIRSLFNSENPPLIAQVLVYKVHTVPIDKDCVLTQTHADELVVNVSNPRAQNPRAQNTPPVDAGYTAMAAEPDLGENDITFHLAPGEQAEVILRVYDPDITDPYVFDGFIDSFAGETEAQAVNTGDTEPEWVTQPDVPWIDPLPAIVASPISMSFGALGGAATLDLSLSGLYPSSSLPYGVTVDGSYNGAPWLTVAPVSGDLTGLPLAHAVAVDTGGLPPGSYVGWIAVSVPQALNNPVRIPVYLNTNVNLTTEMDVSVLSRPVADGAAYDFGTVEPGSTVDVSFLIRNSGTATLTLAGRPIVTITGPDADQFSVRQQPAYSVSTGGTTTLIIRFQPTSPGPKTAAISIANNDLDENPYDLALQGAGAASALVAYYPFTGTADDESGNGNDGSLLGSAVFTGDRSGNISAAIGLNGTDAYVEALDSASFDSNFPLTLSAWIYLNDNSKGGIIGQWGTGGLAGDAYVMYVKGAKLATYVPRTGLAHLEILSNASLTTGEWHQVGMVSTGSSVALYIDGVLDKTEAVTVEQVNSDQTVKIGYENNIYGSPNYLNGRIDDVRIYGRALSAAEIQALYSLEAGRVVYYPFNGNADDESGNQLHGTVDGAVLAADAAGNPDRAYSFDGVDDAIAVPGDARLDITGQISLVAWVYPTTQKTQDIVRRSPRVNTPPNPFGLGLSETGDVVFELSLNGTRAEARKRGYDLNKWSLLVGTFDGRAMRLYVNGTLTATYSAAGTIDAVPQDTLVIGTRLQLPADTFQGTIDDIRVYGRVLSAAEVQALYQAKK